MKKDLLKGLTEEQIAKAKGCKNQEELLALAKAEGVELTDEQLSIVSGGGLFCSDPTFTCPECGSNDINSTEHVGSLNHYWSCECKKCGHRWTT
jgi:predicted RNA-binding Zn-ribbon protein involved in translation (DUF1610 family)